MADYHPLIARAVSSLERNTGDSRRALYERARTALLAQLRGVDPALSEADITRERLALEEAIRRVESEAARRPRVEAQRWEPASEPEDAAVAFRGGAAGGEEIDNPLAAEDEPPVSPEAPAEEAPGRRISADRDFAFMRGARGPRSLSDEGLKDFRHSMAEGAPGEAARPIGQAPQDPFDAFTPPNSETKRIEPDFEVEDLLRSPRELPSPPPAEARPRTAQFGAESERPQPDRFRPPPGKRALGGGFRPRNLVIAAAVVALAAAAFFGYRQWPGMFGGKMASSPPQTAQKAPQASGKIADRVGAEGKPGSAAPADHPAAEVAQRVVLYEQAPNSQERKQYLGSVIWRTETVSPGPGLPPDVAIKADVEIPERQMRMSFTLQRNLDKNLPASHTIEVLFSTPPNFANGGIDDVPGLLMQESKSGAAPLAGLRVKVTEGYFLIGLSTAEPEVQRNELLLKQRPWLQIPISYKNGQHALIAMEKGVPGERVFAEAFAAWKQ